MPSETALRCFLAAARLHSFTRASEELYMTRQAVSRQIMLMERELGTKLFHRTTAKVELTAAGEIYAKFYEDMFEAWQEVQRKVKRVNEEQGETIRIGCIHSTDLGEYILRIVEALRQQGTQLRVDWEHREAQELASALEAGYFDVIFTFGECCQGSERLEHCVFEETRGVIVVRKDYFGKNVVPTIAQLENEPCFITKSMIPNEMQKQEFIEMWRQYGLNLTDVKLLPNRESTQTMVELGRGMTLATSMERFSRSPNICQIPLHRRTQIFCAWRRDENRNPVTALVEMIRSRQIS